MRFRGLGFTWGKRCRKKSVSNCAKYHWGYRITQLLLLAVEFSEKKNAINENFPFRVSSNNLTREKGIFLPSVAVVFVYDTTTHFFQSRKGVFDIVEYFPTPPLRNHTTINDLIATNYYLRFITCQQPEGSEYSRLMLWISKGRTK